MNPKDAESLRWSRRRDNLEWRKYEYNRGLTKLKSLPDVFAIESTNYCNIKCVMCPRGEPDIMERALGHMADDVFKKVIDGWEFFSEPCWFHLFGEPLMHPRLFEQIEYAKAAGISNLGISSNATLLTQKKAEQILDSRLDTMLLCIDGNDKETYEQIRKSAAFTYEEVCENVRNFLTLKKRMGKTKPRTIVQIIVMEQTKTQLAPFKEMWEAAGADEVAFKQYTTWGSQDERFGLLAPSEQQGALGAVRKHACFFMWQSVVVHWDGRVVPCCYDFDGAMVVGDLKEQSLAEIWNGLRYQTLRGMELDGANTTPLCVACTDAPGIQRDPNWPEPSVSVNA